MSQATADVQRGLRLGQTTLGATIAVAFAIAGCMGLPGASEQELEPGQGTQTKEETMAEEGLKYGFRYDPMKFVESDRSLQGALLRTLVLDSPKPGDGKLIQAEIDKILAEQLPDGRLSDDPKHSLQFTAGKLIRLAEMGCPNDRPEVKKALAAVLGKKKPNQADPLGIYDVRAFCLLGIADSPDTAPLVRAGLNGCMEREKEWSNIWEGCPWTPIEHLITLWHGRDIAKTEPTVAKALAWIADGINPAGCLSYKDPWGFVRLASVVDHPLARTMLEKQLPMVLRGQAADAGWGDRTLFVMRALKKHGLLEELRNRPPLPPDWRIAKSIPAPEADCFSLTWDGARLWTYCRKTNEAIAVSPADGRVDQRVKLPVPGIHGIGWWDGALAATAAKAKHLLRIDPATGKTLRDIPLEGKVEWVNGVEKVGDALWVSDGFEMVAAILDPGTGKKLRSLVLGGPLAVDYAATPDGVWHIDGWAPALIKSGTTKHGHLLDWGEKPFDGHCQGIAFDGKQLWALDAKGKRICVIEKATAKPEPSAAPKQTSALEPDYSRLKLKGNGMAQDSFSLAVQAAARLLRRRPGYEAIYAMSGNAFSPCINPQEDCTSWWHVDARCEGIDRVAARFGLKARKLEFPKLEGSWRNEDALKRARQKIATVIAKAIEAGEVVLTAGGWNTKQEHGFVPWCWAGIIVEAKPDGTILGACLNGRSDNVLAFPYAMWALSRAEPTLKPYAADVAMLQDAVGQIRSNCVPYADRRDHVFGLAAMDLWIAKMRQTPFCGPCFKSAPDRVWTCAHDNGNTTLNASKAAASYMRKRKDTFDGKAQPHLDAAAAHYDAIVKLLEPAVTKDSPDHYRHFIGDLEKQKEHAKVLEQVKAELAAAADEMEKALEAEGVTLAARSERSSPTAVIRGLEKMDWGGSFWTRQDSFMACFTEVLRCAGRDVTYAEVVGMSGAAFKLTTGEDNWCPSQAICDVGADCPDQALAAFGFAREMIDLNEDKNPDGMAKARKAIVESIDRGLPVMYMDGERSLVVGYRDGGKTFVCRVYAGEEPGYKDMPKLRGMIGDAWFVEVLRREGDPPKRRAAVVESLRNALRLARTPSLGKGTTNGLAAYETWIKKLKNPPQKPNLHGHAYVSSILLTSRQAAADYLRQIADEFEPDAAKRLRAAADRYERVSKRMWDNRGLMEYPWDKSWTAENRAKEAEMMLADLTDERAAVAEIEGALASNRWTNR